MIKAAFFDIDGTLLSDKTGHVIPQSAKDALVELRRRGVKCCICSGRPKAHPRRLSRLRGRLRRLRGPHRFHVL